MARNKWQRGGIDFFVFPHNISFIASQKQFLNFYLAFSRLPFFFFDEKT